MMRFWPSPPRSAAVGLFWTALLVATACTGTRRPAPVSPPEAATPAVAAERSGAGAGDAVGGVYHVVLPGQTLWRIARAYGVSQSAVAEANGITDPTRIEVGSALLIPGARTRLEVPPYPAPPRSWGEDPVEAPRATPETPSFTWPVPGGRILSRFGEPRGGRRHQGLDIRAGRDQSVLAARAGKVVYSAASMRGYGKTVVLEHGRGLRTLYAHNSRLLVRTGERVERGQPIALVGRTGNATTEHCHFEIRWNDVPVDPLPYLRATERAAR